MLTFEKSTVYICWGCALAAVAVCCNVRVTGDRDCGAKGLGGVETSWESGFERSVWAVQ